jgi:hypothetical protein
VFAIPAILITLAASIIAPKNGEQQRWLVQLSNSKYTDTLTLSFKEDSTNYFTVSESLAGEPNFKVKSRYMYSATSGMAWRARDSACDSSRLKNRGICRTVSSLMTQAFAFAVLGNVFYLDPEGEKALLRGQCSLPNNCRLGSVYVLEASRDLQKKWRDSTLNSLDMQLVGYCYRYGMSIQNFGIRDSALFLGDSICLFASYATYPGGPFDQVDEQQVDTVLLAHRIEFQMPAEGLAAAPHRVHASVPLVFRDMHAFQAWKDAQGEASVSAIGVNGEKATVQHGAGQMFVRSQGHVYRVLIFGD